MITNEDALIAVARIAGMVKFVPSGDIERSEIANTLMQMVNWPPERKLYRYDDDGRRVEIPYVPPAARLERFVRFFCMIEEWPGGSQMRAVYCKMYAPADGIDIRGCSVPGFMDEQSESGTDLLSLYRGKEPPLLRQPGDEPIGEDLRKRISAGARVLVAGEE